MSPLPSSNEQLLVPRTLESLLLLKGSLFGKPGGTATYSHGTITTTTNIMSGAHSRRRRRRRHEMVGIHSVSCSKYGISPSLSLPLSLSRCVRVCLLLRITIQTKGASTTLSLADTDHATKFLCLRRDGAETRVLCGFVCSRDGAGTRVLCGFVCVEAVPKLEFCYARVVDPGRVASRVGLFVPNRCGGRGLFLCPSPLYPLLLHP